MEQLTQQLKNGAMNVQEVPVPVCGPGMVLVQNHYSVISAGTEGATVKAAHANLYEKARQRPDQVRRVLEVLQKQGPLQTWRTVMKKLDAYSPLGYSSAGVILEVGAGVTGMAVGDKVACAGAGYASHAEIIAVPQNLCAVLPPDADLKRASYNTLGAIALQGIRQADLRLGEVCAVIGLGLIGQLTGLLLRASGVRVVGIDIDPQAVATAAGRCADLALTRSDPGLNDAILRLSNGLGVDAVIITAATKSLDPVNFAGQIARKRGRVVVVGDVPTGFDRNPYYYRKELALHMSCSYGPGRYDPAYEEKGIDYPAAYVRWTERRNMEAFQQLVHEGRIDLDYLTTHEWSLEEAPQAYELILNHAESFLGMVIRYDVSKPVQRRRVTVASGAAQGQIGIAFIGAGSYAQGSLLPNLPRHDPAVSCRGVMTSNGTTSKRVAERFGFEFATSDIADLLENPQINTVFITTRHDTHGSYVMQALRAGKNVFVEKPLALTEQELEDIQQAYAELQQTQAAAPALMVGFNRRFAPLAVQLKQRLGKGPMSILYRVNAGTVPAEHWIQDRALGGGRIVGEACHFIDFMTHLCGSLPRRVSAAAMADPQQLNDTFTAHIEFENGSTGTLCYFANGSKSLDKEYVEVYQAGWTGILQDFRTLELYGAKGRERKRLLAPDKGQAAMIKTFLEGIKSGQGSPIPFIESYATTLATFAIEKSLAEHTPMLLALDQSEEILPALEA